MTFAGAALSAPVVKKIVFLLALAAASPALAQNSAQPLQGLDNFTIAPVRPAPAPVVTPSAVPTPMATPAAAPTAAPTPSPRATRTPTPNASPTPAPARTPTAQPAAPSIVTPTPEVSPTPVATATPAPVAAPARGSAPLWPWLLGAVLLAVAGLGAWIWRRRSVEEALPEPAVAPVSAPEPAPEPTPATPRGLVTSRLMPEITIDLRVVRAGTDTLRAVVEYEIDVRNDGRAAAQQVWVEALLLSAAAGPDAELEAFFTAQPTAPVAPPFGLPSGGAGTIAGIATIDRDRLHILSAGERRMFVPLLAVRVLYAHSAASMVSENAAFLIGIERPGEARMAPLRLDGVGMREDVGVRRHVLAG